MFDSPPFLIDDVIRGHARCRAARPALVFEAETRTWLELDAGIERVARALVAVGLAKGERVALLASNQPAALEAQLGVVRAGGVVTPLSGMLPSALLSGMLTDSGARFLLFDAPMARLAHEAGEAARLPRGARIPIGALDRSEPDVAMPRLAETDSYNIIYSSGTTGTPKGIVHDHRSRALGALSLGLEFRIDPTAVTILATPLYTNGTWMTLMPTLVTGGTLMLLPRFTAEGFLDAVEGQGGTHAFLVPTQIRAVLDALATTPRDIGSLRMIVCAGSPIPRAWKNEAMAVFGGRLMELYGLTEGVGATLRPEDMPAKPDSVGTPIMGTEIRILGEDDQPVGPGQLGEIVGYGAGLMRGYHNRPEATEAAIWRDERGRSFLRTGDIGRMDEDGFLYVVDRKKDMIVSGGINVFATDIEQVLHGHPQVRDVAVVGAAHPKWVETPVAVVIAAAGADAEAIRAWANARLGKHQQLDRVVLRETDFPRNALGKVLKRELREALAAEAALG